MSHTEEAELIEAYKSLQDALDELENSVKKKDWENCLKRIKYIREELL